MTALILNPAAKKKNSFLFCFYLPLFLKTAQSWLEANPLTKYLTAAHSSRCWVVPHCLCAHCATMVCSQCTADCGKRLKRECLHSTSTERANWSGLCGGEWQEEGNYAETVAVALSCWSVSVWASFSFLSFLFFPGLKCAYSTAGFSHTAPLLDLKSPLIPATWCSLGTLWAPSAGSGRHLVVTLCACIQTGDEISRL